MLFTRVWQPWDQLIYFIFFLLMICLKAFIYKILWTINFFFVYVYLTLFNLWIMFCIAHGTYRYRLTRLAMQVRDWCPVGQFLIYQNKTFKILNLFQINCSSLCEGVTVICLHRSLKVHFSRFCQFWCLMLAFIYKFILTNVLYTGRFNSKLTLIHNNYVQG